MNAPDCNLIVLATATAMQAPTERHLLRRQQYFAFILQDIVYQAYQRAAQIGTVRPLPTQDYAQLFTLTTPDISRSDDETLARAARDLTQALTSLAAYLPARSPTFTRLALALALKTAGSPQPEAALDRIVEEAYAAPPRPPPIPPAGGWGGRRGGRGGYVDYLPSPRPSPWKGEGV